MRWHFDVSWNPGDFSFCQRCDAMAAEIWFCEVLYTEFGPLTWDDLRGMATRGTLRPKDRVREQGGDWRSASEVDGLFASSPGDDATDFEVTRKPVDDDATDFEINGKPAADDATDFEIARPPSKAPNEDLDFDLSG